MECGKYADVVEFVDNTYMVRKYVQAGWVILNVCTFVNQATECGYHSVLLGWPEGTPVVTPKDDRSFEDRFA